MFQHVNIFFILLMAVACGSVAIEGTSLTEVAPLPVQLKECSGLIHLGHDTFIGLNDSGNPAELFLFKLGSTSVAKVLKISGVTNHDCEELNMDEEYIYISDTGNNAGTRKNLAIYRIRKDQLFNETGIIAEIISFNYPEQVNFAKGKKHNFDCEAMVCAGDSLYLFTKNRINHMTDLYSLPKIPGNYNARHLGQFDAQGLVTGAAFRTTKSGNELALVGYKDKENGYHPFIVYFDKVNGTQFFETTARRFIFSGKQQTETIMFFDEQNVYVTNEGEHGDKTNIYKVNVKN